MIRCPHCREVFSDEYYENWHVPCPKEDHTISQYTLNHLDAWLAKEYTDEDEREVVRHKIITMIKEDLDYWSEQGWRIAHDRAMKGTA
jgi:hypothetical protein